MCTSITRLEAEHRLQEHFNFLRERIELNYSGRYHGAALAGMNKEMESMNSFLDIIFSHEVQNDNGHQS